MSHKSKEEVLGILKNGKIKLATVSGIFTTKPNLIEWVDSNMPEIDLITSKSYQVKPNQGNREPILLETKVGCYANAVGLRNPGMEQGYKDLIELKNRHSLRSLLNVSLSANSIEDFITLVKKFEDVADILELNFSCPHAAAGYGSSIGTDAEVVAEYMREIRKATTALLFPKLTPNVDNIGEIALSAVEAGADGISAINTVGPEVHKEPHTGKPILYNPKGHKGGKSGEWIKEIARQKIKEIRDAVGEEIPIIGMGGVRNGEDVQKMKDAGANVVGIGSVFARVPMPLRSDFISALKKDAENETNISEEFLLKERIAEYKPYKITEIIEKSEDLKIFKTDGKLDYKASQFVFIWVPETGEKPFSIAKDNPLSFVIRKRHYDPEQKKGLVTHVLFQMKEADELMVRGVYGADAPKSSKKNACIVAGGTGIAVVPKLAETLRDQGKGVDVCCGVKSDEQVILKDEIEKCAKYNPVADNGVVGRALEVMKSDLEGKNAEDFCFYNIGPVPFMQRAVEIQKQMGADIKDIFVSLETNNMCGMGVCGECECGGKLTCQEGTFFSMDFLESKQINISDLIK